MTDIVNLIRQGIRQPGKSLAGLSRALGKDPSVGSKILAGKRAVKAREVAIIEGYFAASEIKPQAERTLVDNPQQSVAPDTVGRVTSVPGGVASFHGPRDLPILGHVKGGVGAYFIDQGSRLGTTMRPPMLADNKEAYAVRVHDFSMKPIQQGWVLFVDPYRQAKPGDLVVVQLHDGQAFIKQLLRRTERAVICEQFNPAEQIEYKTPKVKAVHLVVLISPFEP